MKPHLVLGVDPGFSGTLAIYDALRHTIVSLIDMPVTKKKDAKTVIDLHALANFIDIYAKEISIAMVEEVHAMPDQGVTSMFRFGQGYGAVQGILASSLVPTFYVKPSVWKLQMGLSSDKSRSIEKAKTMFPTEHRYFTRKKDDGRAEALLLAVYGAGTVFLNKHGIR